MCLRDRGYDDNESECAQDHYDGALSVVDIHTIIPLSRATLASSAEEGRRKT